MRISGTTGGRARSVLVVGGGFYGLATAVTCAERGWQVGLVEQAHCGGAASAASLRVVHGGIRALKRGDLMSAWRFARALAEWRRRFPRQVMALPCVIPYGLPGFPGRSAAALAMIAMRLLGGGRRGAGGAGLLSADERAQTDPWGGLPPAPALRWHDGVCPDPEALIGAMARRLVHLGGWIREHTEVVGFIREGGRVRGVLAAAQDDNGTLTLKADRVVLACGADSDRMLALPGGLSGPPPAALMTRWGFNVLFPAAAQGGVAVARRLDDGRLVFAVPLPGAWLVGAGYADGPSAGEDFRRLLPDLFPGLIPAEGQVLGARLAFPVPCGTPPPAFPPAGYWIDRPVPGLVRVHGTKFTLAWEAARQVTGRLAGH